MSLVPTVRLVLSQSKYGLGKIPTDAEMMLRE
jgi:hypothetical protein